jgi:hypothetical protein
MKKTPKNSSLLSSMLTIFSRKPAKTTMKTVQKGSVRVVTKHNKKKYSGVDYPYRAAEIVVADPGCDAARVLAGTRFLLRDVPHIPLPECTSRKCACTYVRYLDRRNQHMDRRAEFSILTNVYSTIGNEERRRRIGRRADDPVFS